MSVDKTLDQAIEHHVNGQLDEALTLYLQALQLNPRTPMAADLISAILRTHFELALTLMKVGRNKDAILSFQRVLAIQPDEPVVHAYLSRLFISADDLDQATLHLRHYLRLVPEDHIGARMLLAYTGAEAIPERPTQSYLGVNSSAYYTHGQTYLAERATQSGFSVNVLEPTVLWIENDTPVHGLCVVLSKPAE